jgi:GNAT superfamily N-acetyltransferase
MALTFEPASPDEAAEFVRLRGMTRENAVSEARLRSLGITAASWAHDIQTGELVGFVGREGPSLGGYCFGNTRTGEVVVLALLPAHEGQGVGRRLLSMVVDALRSHGHTELFLGCAADPAVRSYGFYRHLGWRSTGTVDALGDEVLMLTKPIDV